MCSYKTEQKAGKGGVRKCYQSARGTEFDSKLLGNEAEKENRLGQYISLSSETTLAKSSAAETSFS